MSSLSNRRPENRHGAGSLRIGVLGAARIATEGIVDPAATDGHRLVAVAASTRSRAERFAAEHGVEHALDGYQDVIDDPQVDVIYNPLVNSLHTRWNLSALAAGKQVLSEKPLALNVSEARRVRDAAARSSGGLVEGFHYLHHPSVRRIEELVRTGSLGEISRVEIVFDTESPPDSDPRWSYGLGGGATMDLGCYALHAHRQLARWTGSGEPTVAGVTATRRLGRPGLDEAMRVELDYLPGATATARWNMNAPERRMTFTVVGSRGSVTHPAFAVPHMNNRLLSTLDGRTRVEVLGDTTSYTYQLRRLAASLDGGPAFPLDIDDAVANADLIDAVYRTADLPLRGDLAQV